MLTAEAAVGMLVVLLALLLTGVQIGVALGLTGTLGVYFLVGRLSTAISVLGTTAFEAIRDYVFAVVPLFMLMGVLVSRSGAAADLYRFMDRLLKGVPGKLAAATIAGNAVFAAVTGVSIAAASLFTKVAYPQMARAGYDSRYALGSIAGGSTLGMLIPPSVLFIVWGVLTEQPIGKLFIAGVIPGLILALLYGGYVIIAAWRIPSLAPSAGDKAAANSAEGPVSFLEVVGVLSVGALIVLVLGGIWGGLFTPTEAAGVGALGALLLALAKRVGWRELSEAVVEAGRSTAPILFLLITAQIYSRFLTLSGIISYVQDLLSAVALQPWMVVAIMIATWVALGAIIDSTSIVLITVPIFAPVAHSLGVDPMAFAVIGVLSILIGLLTPPFGMSVFAVKGALEDPEIRLGDIFKGTVPYWIMLVTVAVMVAVFPGLASWLPSLI